VSGTRTLLLALLGLAVLCPVAQAAPADVGKVRYVKEFHSGFDRYTLSPTPQSAEWMREHYYRSKAYYPYFDTRTAWFPDAWAYKDLYAIYSESALARDRQDWILKDSSGRKLFIPWGCDRGACPQYAGDVGNPDFRAHWIQAARATLDNGYRGLFIDDVNMEFRVGDGSGAFVAPIDPRTGAPMTHADWKRYVADFAEEIRRAFPNHEIAHNAIWFSGHDDPSVQRELRAADWVVLERGVSDSGLTNGGGRFGFETLLQHVEWIHAQGRAVHWDAYADTRAGAEYNLATYFLVGNGSDALRTDYRETPDDWWSGWEVDLGAPKGARYDWQGVLRRDFDRGFVLVNPPGAPSHSFELPAAARGPDGAGRASVRLEPASGAVVVLSQSNPPGSAPAATPSVVIDPVPNPAPASVPPASGAPAKAREGKRASARGKRRQARRRAMRQHTRLRRTVLLRGRVRRAKRGTVRVQLRTRRQARVRVVRSFRLHVHGARFRGVARGLRPGRYVVRARYLNRDGRPGRPTMRRFRIRY
jgi:hypothetical protein